MDFYEALNKRHSYRGYTDQPIPKDALERIGEAVSLAPTACNRQPCEIQVVINDELREKIAAGIKKVDKKKGVLILTDMFGGTPSNLSYSFLEEGQVEVISGVNLPILIKAVDIQKDMELSELAQHLEAFGKKSISLASGILKGNKRE